MTLFSIYLLFLFNSLFMLEKTFSLCTWWKWNLPKNFLEINCTQKYKHIIKNNSKLLTKVLTERWDNIFHNENNLLILCVKHDHLRNYLPLQLFTSASVRQCAANMPENRRTRCSWLRFSQLSKAYIYPINSVFCK